MRKASAADKTVSTKPKSNCILIWMDGGPTHFETFDPKPEAPVEIRGEFRPIETNVIRYSYLRAHAEARQDCGQVCDHPIRLSQPSQTMARAITI